MSAIISPGTVAPDYRARRSAALRLLRQGADIAVARHDEDAAVVFRDAEARLVDGELLVVVCGEFKGGKSTLINALLDEPGLLPSDIDITTSVVSTVSWAAAEEITAVFAQADGTLVRRRVSRRELSDYVTERGNPENALGIVEVQIRLPKAQLENGLTIADTPGTGGRNAKHTAAAYDFVRRAAAALFVWDVGKRLTENELAFLDVIGEYAHKIVFVLTKIDQDPDFEDTLQAERAKLGRRLGVDPATLTIIPVSSTGKLRYLEHADPRDRELSGFRVLEDAVWGKLAQESGDLMVLRALSELQRGLSAVVRPLEAERSVVSQTPTAELVRATEEREQMEARLEDLTSDSPVWVSRLEDLMDRAWNHVAASHKRLFDDIDDHYRDELAKDSVISSSDELVNELCLECVRAVGELTETLRVEAGVVHDEVRNSSGLEVVGHLGEVEWDAPEPGSPLGRLRTGNVRTTSAVLTASIRGGGFGFHAGGGAATTVITLAGGVTVTALPIIGAAALAGGVLFAGYRGRRALKSIRRHDMEVARDRLDQVILPMLSDARDDAHAALQDAHRELLLAMRSEFRSRLTQELNVCKRTLQELGKHRTTLEEMSIRAAEIDRTLAEARTVEAEGEALVASLITEA